MPGPTSLRLPRPAQSPSPRLPTADGSPYKGSKSDQIWHPVPVNPKTGLKRPSCPCRVKHAKDPAGSRILDMCHHRCLRPRVPLLSRCNHGAARRSQHLHLRRFCQEHPVTGRAKLRHRADASPWKLFCSLRSGKGKSPAPSSGSPYRPGDPDSRESLQGKQQPY